MEKQLFVDLLRRVASLVDLPVGEVRRLLEESEEDEQADQSKGLCVSRIIDQEFFDKAVTQEGALRDDPRQLQIRFGREVPGRGVATRLYTEHDHNHDHYHPHSPRR